MIPRYFLCLSVNATPSYFQVQPVRRNGKEDFAGGQDEPSGSVTAHHSPGAYYYLLLLFFFLQIGLYRLQKFCKDWKIFWTQKSNSEVWGRKKKKKKQLATPSFIHSQFFILGWAEKKKRKKRRSKVITVLEITVFKLTQRLSLLYLIGASKSLNLLLSENSRFGNNLMCEPRKKDLRCRGDLAFVYGGNHAETLCGILVRSL